MKILIASDIHGSAYYCDLMLRTFEEEQADRLLLLGDILYHGPRNDLPVGYEPKKVIEQLRAVKDRILCVRGNCDADVDLMVLPFPVMAESALLPIGNKMMFVTHGHLHNPEKMPSLPSGDILLFGHTHLPLLREVNGCMCINPGSVSIPKGGSCHSCIVLKDGIFGWKDIETGKYYRHYDSLANDKPM